MLGFLSNLDLFRWRILNRSGSGSLRLFIFVVCGAVCALRGGIILSHSVSAVTIPIPRSTRFLFIFSNILCRSNRASRLRHFDKLGIHIDEIELC